MTLIRITLKLRHHKLAITPLFNQFQFASSTTRILATEMSKMELHCFFKLFVNCAYSSIFFYFRCCCGRTLEQHKYLTDPNPMAPGEIWYPSRCTVAYPTDAYGTLEFQGGPHPSKAQVSPRIESKRTYPYQSWIFSFCTQTFNLKALEQFQWRLV